MKRNIVIIHGLNGSPKGHWQYILNKQLKSINDRVFFPQFSNNIKPNLELWLQELNDLFEEIEGEINIVAHSMGVILLLHYLQKYTRSFNNVLLVAPPSNDFLINNKNTDTFANFPLNPKDFEEKVKNTLLVASNNDIYCKEGAVNLFGHKLSIETLLLADSYGHINIDSGHGKWDFPLKWLKDTGSI